MKFFDINVDSGWWEATYDDFAWVCETIGLTVDTEHTYHSGFSSQGDGASFSADVNLKELVEGINTKAWLSNHPTITDYLGLRNCPVDVRALNLFYNGTMDYTIEIRAKDRPFRSVVAFSVCNDFTKKSNLFVEVDKLEGWLENTVNRLSNYLYRSLEREYEYLTSDDAVEETIISNDYDFLQDGRQFIS